MRLGVVGTGRQAMRYMDPRNGGNMVWLQTNGRLEPYDYGDWLEMVDAVVVATHPDGHRWLALDAIADKKPVLVEKPICLTLGNALEVIDAAEEATMPLEVAHTHLWHEAFPHVTSPRSASVHITYARHDRDYSAWLDWGPHALAMLEQVGAPRRSLTLQRGPVNSLRLTVDDRVSYTGREAYTHTPMWHMVHAFARGATHGYDFHRRVYRRLFELESEWHKKNEMLRVNWNNTTT